MKRLVSRLLFGAEEATLWVAVGLREPQTEVRVTLDGLGPPRNVTLNNVVASLRPLMLGVGLESHYDLEALRRTRLLLRFHDAKSANKLLGAIELRAVECIPIGGRQLCLAESLGHRNYCLPAPQLWARSAFQAYRRWRQRQNPDPYNFQLNPRDLQSLLVFYVCPRPVVLVSVVHGERSNIFPMDLIGPTDTARFSLALRSSSPAVELIQGSRRIAVSSVPADKVFIAYELGKHHKKPSIDCQSLSFLTVPSPYYGLPVPTFALRIREMHVEEIRTVGSHTLFLATPVNDYFWSEGLQLFHVPGFYQACRERLGQPLPPAASS